MDSFGSRLRKVRKEKKYTQAGLAKLIGGKTTHVSVSDWENDKYHPSDDSSRLIEKILDVNYNWLKTGIGDKNPTKNDVDIKDSVSYINHYQAIKWKDVSQWSSIKMDSAVNISNSYSTDYKSTGSCFAVKVETSSAEPLVLAGDTILVDTSINPSNGKLAIISDNGDAILRQVIKDGSVTLLKAVNPDWPDPIIKLTDSMKIIGQVVERKSSLI